MRLETIMTSIVLVKISFRENYFEWKFGYAGIMWESTV